MKYPTLILLLMLVGCSSPQGTTQQSGASPGEHEEVEPQESQRSTVDENETIRAIVTESQVAGFVRHDLEAYIAPWADDAQLVIGRSEESATTDTVWDHSKLLASRRMRFRDAPTAVSMRHEDVTVEVVDDSATLRCRTLSSGQGWTEEMHEVFRLRRAPEGWMIVENRAWPISRTFGGEELLYDGATWARLDQAYDEALDRGDIEAAVNAALAAFRFGEAFETARDAASIGDALALDHLRLGHMAVLIGEEAIAIEAFLEARRRDAEVQVPSWALE